MLLQHFLEPLLLPLRLERPPIRLLQVKVLEHLVQEATALHRHRPRLLGQPRVVVVPIQSGALQVVVERGRAEVIDLDALGVAIAAVRLERLPRVAIRDEGHIEPERLRARRDGLAHALAVSGDDHLCLTREKNVGWFEPRRRARELFPLGFGFGHPDEHGWTRLPQVCVRICHIDAMGAGQRHIGQACLFSEMPVGIGRPRGHETDLEFFEPRTIRVVEKWMRAHFRRKEPMREPGREHDMELQAFGLVNGHHLDGVTSRNGGLRVVGGAGEQRIQRPVDLREQRLRSVESLVYLFDGLEAFDGGPKVGHRLRALLGLELEVEQLAHRPVLDEHRIGEAREGQLPGAIEELMAPDHRRMQCI